MDRTRFFGWKFLNSIFYFWSAINLTGCRGAAFSKVQVNADQTMFNVRVRICHLFLGKIFLITFPISAQKLFGFLCFLVLAFDFQVIVSNFGIAEGAGSARGRAPHY